MAGTISLHRQSVHYFQGMDEFVTTKTVVGEPVTVGDAIILPLVDVTCGMAGGRVLVSRRKRRMRAA